ncbi:hypothetical protein BJV82DRAFT_33423 [Fennellomyces sp. T-0311]|nr:hypothetical protein BJV82DRAFT_33423 [Fennellomyces sp. T-0311]
MRKAYFREKGGNKKNQRQKQSKKKASPTSTVQPLAETPEPSSVALKSLLGVAPTEEDKAPEPSVALKSLLGVQNPKHQTPEASRSASSTSTPEQSSSTETTLLQLLQRATPPPQEPSQSLIALLNGSNKPKPVVDEKPPEHPLIALLKAGGPSKENETLASGQP